MTSASDAPAPTALALPIRMKYCVEVALPKAKSFWVALGETIGVPRLSEPLVR